MRIIYFQISRGEILESLKMEAWVTLATNDSYAVGALTLAQSLKRVNTTKQTCVLLTEEVSEEVKKVLEETFDRAVVVDPLDSKDIVNLKLLERTELGITFTKVKMASMFSVQRKRLHQS